MERWRDNDNNSLLSSAMASMSAAVFDSVMGCLEHDLPRLEVR